MDAQGNTEVALAFLRMAVEGKAEQAVERYVADGAVHHNPHVAAGFDALAEAMDLSAKQNPDAALDVRQTISEGDRVAVHSFVQHSADDRGVSVVHLFRFEQRRIAEFWDVIMGIPAGSPNADGTF